MDKVFIVTEGEYSDYHIVGVFSTPEKAEAIRYDVGGDIEEYLIDALKIYERWVVCMFSNGDTLDIYHTKKQDVTDTPMMTYSFRNSSSANGMVPLLTVTNIAADDEQHAVKIANEIRTRLLAEGKFLVGGRG